MAGKSRASRPPTYPKKPHATGQARIKYRGETKYLGIFKSPESYTKFEAILDDWRRRQAGPRPHAEPVDVATVADLCVKFLEHAQQHYRHPDGKPTTELAAYQQSIKPLVRLHGDTSIEDFGPKAMKEVRAAMVSGSWLDPTERMGRLPHQLQWSRKLVNQRIGRLKRIWKWGASEELVPAEKYHALVTVQGLLAGRTEAPDYDEVTPVEESVVLATLPLLSPVVRAMVEVQRLTGMRPGEVCWLTPGEIDREGLQVDGVRVWVYRPKRHKTAWRGHSKAVVIGPRAQEVLTPFLDRPADAACFSPREGDPRKGDRAGTRYTVDVYGRRIREACHRLFRPPPPLGPMKGEKKKAWLARITDRKQELATWWESHTWHPHQLRHSMATNIKDLEKARTVLGQKDVRVTSLYAARDLRTAAEVIAKIG